MGPDPMHFDARAEVYVRARPPYPRQLWARLGALGLLTDAPNVLELGAGSGQATGPLIAAGASVTAVEPGPALAEILRRRHPLAHVLQASAEDVELEPAGFALAVVATAVHWFDLDVVLPKVHAALEPAGKLAVCWQVFGDADFPTPFRDAVERIVRRRDPPEDRPRSADDRIDWWKAELARGGFFVPVHDEVISWSIELRAVQIHELFSTFSNWTAAEAAEAGRAAAELGGPITEHYRTALIVCDRAPDAQDGPNSR